MAHHNNPVFPIGPDVDVLQVGNFAVCNDGRRGYITTVETDRYTGEIWCWIEGDDGNEFEVSVQSIVSLENRNLIVEPTAEELKNYVDPIANTCRTFLELSDFSRVYTDLYLKLTMGFYYRTGETPEIVHAIAQVWATGLADLTEV